MTFNEHVALLNFPNNFIEKRTFFSHIYIIFIFFVYRKSVLYWKIGNPSLSAALTKIDQRIEAKW